MTGLGVAAVVVAEVVNVEVSVIQTKDCDPATGESPMLSSSSLKIRKYLSYKFDMNIELYTYNDFFPFNNNDCHTVKESKQNFSLAQHTR